VSTPPPSSTVILSHNILVRGHKVFRGLGITAVAPCESTLASLARGPVRELLKLRCERNIKKPLARLPARQFRAHTRHGRGFTWQFRWLGEWFRLTLSPPPPRKILACVLPNFARLPNSSKWM